MIVGVDEAGRGPVLGSMFIAAVAVDERMQLPDGIDDSKRIPDRTRERLATMLRDDDMIRTRSTEVDVALIDDPATNLTDVTIDAVQQVIFDVLPAMSEPVTCILDAADVDEDRYARRVSRGLPAAVDVIAKHGADGEDSVVGAASIIAKSNRERHVESLGNQFGDIGSGYPSDPTTRTFLERYVAENGSLPACARKSWKTSTDVLANAAQDTLGDYS